MDDFILKRDTYKKIKGFDRKQMEQFLADIYANAAEEVAENNAVSLDMDKLRKEIGEIKGVGESRLNEIMAIIEQHLKKD
ncbi:MAG: hypothetical protein IKI94_08160 [Ruminococcus sp.]|nr:hypothetical protein [Ruminococcus sp.]